MELFCPAGRLKNKTQPQMRKEQMMDEYNNYENGYNQNPPPPRRPKKRKAEQQRQKGKEFSVHHGSSLIGYICIIRQTL